MIAGGLGMMLKSFGIDPKEIEAAVALLQQHGPQIVATMVAANARLERIEHKLNLLLATERLAECDALLLEARKPSDSGAGE